MVNERAWARLGALSGAAFVVLMLLSTFLYPQQPRIDSAPATTLAWVHGHRAALEAGMVLGLFAAAFLLWFASHLRTVLGRSDRLATVVFGSGVAAAVTGSLGAIPIGLLCILDAQGGVQNADVVRMLGDSTSVVFATFAIMAVVFLTSLGAAMLQEEVVAPWLGWVAMLAAALNGLAVITSMSFATYHGAGWGVPGWGAYLGFLLVVLATSVSLARAPRTAPERPAVMAAA